MHVNKKNKNVYFSSLFSSLQSSNHDTTGAYKHSNICFHETDVWTRCARHPAWRQPRLVQADNAPKWASSCAHAYSEATAGPAAAVQPRREDYNEPFLHVIDTERYVCSTRWIDLDDWSFKCLIRAWYLKGDESRRRGFSAVSQPLCLFWGGADVLNYSINIRMWAWLIQDKPPVYWCVSLVSWRCLNRIISHWSESWRASCT